MKKTVSLFFVLLMLLSAAGCGQTAPALDENAVDLTALSSTMIYAEVSAMTTNPEEYLGRTVRMEGTLSIYESPETGKVYYACLIQDATACCSQGIEFTLADASATYPEAGTTVTVTGTFGTYMENGYQYCQLTDAVMEL